MLQGVSRLDRIDRGAVGDCRGVDLENVAQNFFELRFVVRLDHQAFSPIRAFSGGRYISDGFPRIPIGSEDPELNGNNGLGPHPPDVSRSETRMTVRDPPVSYTHLRAHETRHDLVCRLL